MSDEFAVLYTARCPHCGKRHEETVRSPDWWFVLWRRRPRLRGLRLVHHVDRGQLVPVTHRVAYLDVYRGSAVALPVGLHWPVRWARRLWEWSFRYRPSALERLLRKEVPDAMDH
jgi:hypothetical protein